MTKCSKSDNSYYIINEIKCVGKITNSGYYNIYLNGLKQDIPINVYSLSLTKALYVEPSYIKFKSPTKPEYIEIFFDSLQKSNKDLLCKEIIIKKE